MPHAPILVIGDSILDRHRDGALERLPREAPVPVLHLPAHTSGVSDVTGADDSALAARVSALAAGSAIEDAVRRANRAAGIAIGRAGTAVVSGDERDRI